MRKITSIIIHASDTPPEMDIGADEIRQWHVEENGWDDIGYHAVIRRNGLVERGRLESVVGAHAYGYNRFSLGICLIGGRKSKSKDPESNFTREQYMSLFLLVERWVRDYNISIVVGHNEVSNKPCPCFNVKEFFGDLK